jgi:hypothetical protein
MEKLAERHSTRLVEDSRELRDNRWVQAAEMTVCRCKDEEIKNLFRLVNAFSGPKHSASWRALPYMR